MFTCGFFKTSIHTNGLKYMQQCKTQQYNVCNPTLMSEMFTSILIMYCCTKKHKCLCLNAFKTDSVIFFLLAYSLVSFYYSCMLVIGY